MMKIIIQIKTWGDPIKQENLENHTEIGENLNIFDF